MSRWMLLSEDWYLNEIATKIGEVLTALALLKFIKIRELDIAENEIALKKKDLIN